VLLLACGPVSPSDASRYLTIEAVPPGPPAATSSGGRWTIYLDGIIESQASGRLAKLIEEQHISSAAVYFNSPGGSLVEAMAIGQVLRQHGYETHVGLRTADASRPADGVCYSACPFAYAGGVRRYLHDGSVIGVHRAANRVPVPDEFAFEKVVSQQATRYLVAMGVSPELYAIMSEVPHNTIRVLAVEEAERLNLVTEAEDSS
jgi:hypothetical protein